VKNKSIISKILIEKASKYQSLRSIGLDEKIENVSNSS